MLAMVDEMGELSRAQGIGLDEDVGRIAEIGASKGKRHPA